MAQVTLTLKKGELLDLLKGLWAVSHIQGKEFSLVVTDNILRAVSEGVLTRNEARERLNLEPITGGDEVYIPSNLFPILPEEITPAKLMHIRKIVA